MVQSRRRVTYVLPPPTDPVPRLQLPPPGASRLGAVGPLLISLSSPSPPSSTPTPDPTPHTPRHRLGVTALALDASTQLAGRACPEGILYTGGRDGQVIAWDLGVPTRRRAGPIGVGERRRWEVLTGWGDDAIDEEGEEGEGGVGDGDVLGEVMPGVVQRRQRAASRVGEVPLEMEWEMDGGKFVPGTPSQFRQCAETHTDWVNDILLCNYNQTVISASSDGTVKAWNPHSSTPSDPVTIGTHSDYVRCLAHCRTQNYVASGSFDRTIKLWDLTRSSSSPSQLSSHLNSSQNPPPSSSDAPAPVLTLSPPDAQAPKASIYALATDPFGHVIASGSPERVVRLWDPRAGKRSGKLVGHTDNIRAILISDDSRYLLTGSADASVKLWSLTTQRCLHTFTHHTDSVWALSSSHPTLETFYSADRAGLLARVDVEGCKGLGEGECVLLARDVGDENEEAEGGEKEPKAEGNRGMGITKICVMDDQLAWTAAGTSSVRRWAVPPRRMVRAGSYTEWESGQTPGTSSPGVGGGRRRAGTASEASTRPSSRGGGGGQSFGESVPSLASDPTLATTKVDDQTQTAFGLPLASLVCLPAPEDTYSSLPTRARDPEVATLYSAASIMSVPRLPVRSSIPTSFHPPSPPKKHSQDESSYSLSLSMYPPTAEPTPLALYEARELLEDAEPVCAKPESTIPGAPGVVRCLLMSDRVHALAVDTRGEVAVWDVVRGVCRGVYAYREVWERKGGSQASTEGGAGSGSGVIEGGQAEMSPREALERVRERIEGEAVVSAWCAVDTRGGVLAVHVGERCFEAEVYADEVGFRGEKGFNDESKLNIGKWVLRNLFAGFIQEEVRQRRQSQKQQDGALPPSIGRAPSSSHHHHHPHQAEADKRLRASSTSPSPESPKLRIPSTSSVTCAPNMLPALRPPALPAVRASPILAPLIPLYPLDTPAHEGTPTPRARSGTLDGATPALPPPSSAGGKDTPAPAAPAGDYFSIRTRRPSLQGGTPSFPSGVPATPDDFSGWMGPSKADQQLPQTPMTPSGIMGKLKNFGRGGAGKRPVSEVASPVVQVVEQPLLNDTNPGPEPPKSALQTLLSGPLTPPSSLDAPLHNMPPHSQLFISDEGFPSYTVLYRGNVASTQHDTQALEDTMPMWLLEYLLLNKIPNVTSLAKVSFVLLPWNKDPDVEPLPELLNTTQSKLTASRYLRIRKIAIHVQDKLDKVSPESRAGSIRSSVDTQHHSSQHHGSVRPRAEDVYEILCNEVILPFDMSLAAVRQYIWRQSAELVMYYRKKRPQRTPPTDLQPSV